MPGGRVSQHSGYYSVVLSFNEHFLPDLIWCHLYCAEKMCETPAMFQVSVLSLPPILTVTLLHLFSPSFLCIHFKSIFLAGRCLALSAILTHFNRRFTEIARRCGKLRGVSQFVTLMPSPAEVGLRLSSLKSICLT